MAAKTRAPPSLPSAPNHFHLRLSIQFFVPTDPRKATTIRYAWGGERDGRYTESTDEDNAADTARKYRQYKSSS